MESINCNKCGGVNSMPEGKLSMFCAFCGSVIDSKKNQFISNDHSTQQKIEREFEYNHFCSVIELSLELLIKENSSNYFIVNANKSFHTFSLNYIIDENKIELIIQLIDKSTKNSDKGKTLIKVQATKISGNSDLLFHLNDFLDKFSYFIDNLNKIQSTDKLTGRDLLYPDVVKLVYETQSPSTSLLQRRLKIGYQRASSIIESLEKDGIIVTIPEKNNEKKVMIKNESELNHFLSLLGINSNKSFSNDELNSKKNKQNKKTGCFIATATMGSYDHPVVMDLRMFRDNWLLKRGWGVKFTNWYYIHGSKAARVIERSILLKMATFILVVKPLQIIIKVIRY